MASQSAAFPMRVVTRLTGLAPDTIRVWERRYKAVVPERTDGKARRYSRGEIERLSLLKRATDSGHPIGQVAALTNEQLESVLRTSAELLAEIHAVGPARWAATLEEYLRAIERFDLRRADELLSRAATLANPRELALDVIAPLLRLVGERWEHGTLSIAQEHAVTTHCRLLLGSQMRAMTMSDAGAERVLLAAPQGHQHDLGLLIGGVLVASRGATTIHLGADVPWRELEEAVRIARPHVLVLAFARDLSPEERRATPAALRRLASLTDVWIGTPPGHALSKNKDVRVFCSFEELDSALALRLVA